MIIINSIMSIQQCLSHIYIETLYKMSMTSSIKKGSADSERVLKIRVYEERWRQT